MRISEHQGGATVRTLRIPYSKLGRFNDLLKIDKSSYDGRFTSPLGRGYCTASQPYRHMFYTFTELPAKLLSK